jgi:hypothetical protein
VKNNQLLYFFAALFILSSASTFSQEVGTDSSAKVYDLNDFKFRYQRYKALTFDYRMNGGFQLESGKYKLVKQTNYDK